MWSEKAQADIGVDESNLVRLDSWVWGSCDSDNRQRVSLAMEAQEALSYVYDEYRDVAHPIYVGVDIPKKQVFFIRRSAKGGYYIAAETPVSFI